MWVDHHIVDHVAGDLAFQQLLGHVVGLGVVAVLLLVALAVYRVLVGL